MEHRFMISNHIFLMQTVIRMQREDLRIISEIIGYRWNFRKTDKRNSTGQREALLEVLANDPRPRYQNRPDKVYGLAYGHKDIHFQVRDDILTVCDVTEFSSQKSFDKQNNV